MITILKNPKTIRYLSFKETVLSNDFPWFWYEKSVLTEDECESLYKNIPTYSHTFLRRPENNHVKFPTITSNVALTENLYTVFDEILEFNHINVNSFFRMNANCIHPQKEVFNTNPHVDHDFPHNNIIIYLTNSGGKTFVGEDYHDPKEDDVIFFGGETHYLQTPKDERRIILVGTFI